MPISQADYLAMLARTAPKRTPNVPQDAVIDESSLHNSILSECRVRGWIALHGSMAHRARRTLGEPDFVIVADGGRVFFMEAKTRSGKLSSEQLALQAWAHKLGHTVHVVRSMSEFLEIVNANPNKP